MRTNTWDSFFLLETVLLQQWKTLQSEQKRYNRNFTNSKKKWCFFSKLFDAQIAPTLFYAVDIWGFKMYEQIERVHLFACKRFLHVRNNTPNDVIYGELGRYPLFIPATVRFVKYWLKLLRQTDNLYSKKSYKMLLEMQNRGKTTWVSHIR